MSHPLFVALPAMVAAALSFALTPSVRRLAIRLRAIDQPDPRKVHKRPIPRMGGLSVVVAATVVTGGAYALGIRWYGAVPARLLLGLSLGLVPVLVVSIWDDITRLPAWAKFLGHALGAAIAMWCGVRLNPEVHLFGATIHIGFWAIPISFLWLVGLTSAFNLVDGLDGLSAGLALISCGSLVAVFLIAGRNHTAAIALVLAGSLIGFLPWNMFPARIFLGDTGACSLGFWLGCLTLGGGSTLSAGFAALLPLLVLGLPVADTLLSILRRAIGRFEHRGGSGVFQPDRNHIHHRLLALGIDHRRAVLILYGVGLLLAACGLLSLVVTARKAALLLIALLVAGLVGVARLGYEEFAVVRRGLVLRFYDAPMLHRSVFVVFADLVMVAAAVAGAVAIKYEDWLLVANHAVALSMFATLAPVTVSVFWAMGMYRGSWRLASVDDFLRACYAVSAASFAGYVILQLSSPSWVPLSLFLIYGLLKLLFANASRVSYRVLALKRSQASHRGRPVLVYGAGRYGASLTRDLLANADAAMRPVAFIDDNPLRVGRRVNGLPVVGRLEDLEHAIRDYRAVAVVVSSSQIEGRNFERAAEVCARTGARLLRMQVRFEPYSLPTPLSRGTAELRHAAVMRAVPGPVAVAQPGLALWSPSPGE